MRAALNRLILQGRGGDPQREVGIIKITDTAPTAAGLLTGKLMTPIPAVTPGSWIESETVFVLWMNASDVPPEISVNTFGFANNFIGHRIGPITSGGTNRSLWVVNQSSMVVPVYLGNLTPTSGSYHDATIDPEGAGAGSTSTCWALCINSAAANLASFGPYIGLLSGKVTVGGSERPRVLFMAYGTRISGEDSSDVAVTNAFVQSITFNVSDFDITAAGAVSLAHDNEQVAVRQAGTPIGKFSILDFLTSATASIACVDAGSGRVTIEVSVVGGPFVPTSDVDTSPVADKILRAGATGVFTFTPSGSGRAGINVGSQAGNPAAAATGDMWYDSSAGRLKISR
jgi:hypothetical protein